MPAPDHDRDLAPGGTIVHRAVGDAPLPGLAGVRGVGEPPAIPGLAAVVNALSAATGVRLRRVPVDWSDLVAARSA